MAPHNGEPVRFAVVGTPGDRRVRLFAEAVAACGLPEPHVVPWREVLTGGAPHIPEGASVRIDSPGEDAETDALLRGPGDPTRVGGGARWYASFRRGLASIAAAPGIDLLDDVDEIAVMFDKRVCHARLAAAGVPVPPALTRPVDSYDSLREQMADMGWSRVFVKPAHGSSASGVIAFQVNRDRLKAVTSIERTGNSLHNSLRVRAYETEPEVRALVDALAPDGLHVERWFPKASLGGRNLDLRVVTVAGVAVHGVVRTSTGPMTNLHLGGARGDLDAVRRRLGDRGWQHLLRVCGEAAACFPGSLRVGVDLMVSSDWRTLAVAEVNAFGDLLPGLPDLEGRDQDTYTAQVRTILNGWRGPRHRRQR
ncbi:STM4014 family protein [Sinosporangium siamense]|uniref:ATP-grasp domain-containing protein n=1 Tax=Sinosporangium siamense TaxID=1367973 RepID=A0A919V544_9ACTN|nr:STM4014 family protein [Sinosporangium siamense]GII91173.1 hypothetical protein Ssi02_14040 [Sinosporangium siamense]